MRVDGGIGSDLSKVGEATSEAEAAGYDGVWSAETSHDPFLPLLLAAERTEKLQLGTGIAVAFAAKSDDPRPDRQRPPSGTPRVGFCSGWARRSSRTS